MSPLRREVLSIFKRLHRTRLVVFEEDDFALNAARLRINDEFKKNKYVQNPDSVDELVNLAKGVDVELRTGVIQAKRKPDGTYVAKITPDTTKLDNVMYDPNAVIEKPRKGNKKCK